MKLDEICPCSICGNPVAQDVLTTFYRVRLQPMRFDANALWQQLIGAPTDEAVAVETTDERTSLICQHCAHKPQQLLDMPGKSKP